MSQVAAFSRLRGRISSIAAVSDLRCVRMPQRRSGESAAAGRMSLRLRGGTEASVCRPEIKGSRPTGCGDA